MKVLIFDIWGDFGHFRKFYTTSSPLSFSFPPPPTIAGILGAIYGTDKFKNEYLRVFNYKNCRIALKILNPIKKIRMGLNLINTKDNHWQPVKKKNHEPRTQIRTEFIKDPKYRIYVHINNEEIFNDIIEKIKKHTSIFTISFGLSELLTNFTYMGLYESSKIIEGNKPVDLSTPIVVENLKANKLIIETGKKYFREKIPFMMNADRIVEKYEDVIFEPDGKIIKAEINTYYKLENGENINFF